MATNGSEGQRGFGTFLAGRRVGRREDMTALG
jgi:hypothetical protein